GRLTHRSRALGSCRLARPHFYAGQVNALERVDHVYADRQPQVAVLDVRLADAQARNSACAESQDPISRHGKIDLRAAQDGHRHADDVSQDVDDGAAGIAGLHVALHLDLGQDAVVVETHAGNGAAADGDLLAE